MIGTAGHIDHGKTALVRALTGVDTDRLPAEKQRGITIDLGFASLDLGEYHLALVDVPGHERFIRNMLAGASGLDLAMLVVAADDSVMPQTREHLEILRLLGLSGGLVVLTKCDLAEPGWIDMVEDDIRSLVRGSFLEGSAIVRTSATTGQGIDELKTTLQSLCSRVRPADDAGIFRMAIDRVFTVAGHGTVVTGTVASGGVAVGDELEWLPAAEPVRVRGLHRHDRPVERVGRGSRAAINLVGVHHAEVRRGDELAAPGYLEPSRILSVEIVESAAAAQPLRHRGRYKLHLGTAEVSGVLSLLDRDESHPGTAAWPRSCWPSRWPRSTASRSCCALRARPRRSAAGGSSSRRPAAIAVAIAPPSTAWSGSDRPSRSIACWRPSRSLASPRGPSGGSPRWSACPLTRSGPLWRALAASDALVELPVGPRRTVRVLGEYAADLEDRVLRAIARLHAAHPRHSAIPRVHLAAELPDLGSDALVSGLLERLKRQGRIVADARTVALPGHEARLSQAERRLKQELADAIRTGGITPPDASELAASAGPRAGVVPDLLALLRDEQQIAEINPGLYLDADVDTDLRRKVRDRLADGSAITMAELRDLLGTTRKYAVPIGEYLDRIGLDPPRRRPAPPGRRRSHKPLTGR